MRLVNWRSAAIGVAGFGLAACGDDVVVQDPRTLTVSPQTVTCTVGETRAIGASLNPTQANAPFTYASSGAGVTVAGTGATATLTCAQAGSYTVTVTSGTLSQVVTVQVSPAPSNVQAILVNPQNSAVTVGGTVQLTSTIVVSTGTAPAARYRSAQPNIATVDSVSGLVRGVAVGTANILVSPVGQPGLTGTATVTVLGAGQIVQSIVPSPSNVALQTGQTQQLSAQVTLQPGAPAGASRNVTYTSDNPAVATVSSTGLVTGVANGSTAIAIRAVADTSVVVRVPVTVRAPVPVTISIEQITNQVTTQLIDITQPIGTAAFGANLTGSIFARLNVETGDARVSRVDVFLAPAASPNDTTNRVCSQVFSQALAEAYRLAATGAAEIVPITCPINVAAFDTLTGIPGIRNGTSVLRARVTGTFPGSTAGASQIAQFTQPLQILNQSGFFVRVTNTPSAAQAAVNARGTAQGPDGRNWVAGSLNFSLLPVSFEAPLTGNNVTPEITVTLTDANSQSIPAATTFTRTITRPAAASGATVITFPGQTANQPAGVTAGVTANGNVNARTFATADQNIDGFTSGPVINQNGVLTGGTTVTVSGIGFNTTTTTQFGTLSVTLNGQTLQTSGTVQNQFPGTFQINIDNQAPQPATQFNVAASNFTQIPGSFVGFIGGAFNVNDPASGFAGRNFGAQFGQPPVDPTVAGNTPVTVNADFGGVDRVTTSYFAQLVANLASLTAANVFTGGTQFSNGSQLAAANQNTAYAAIARFVDVLGNARNQLVEQGTITLTAQGQIAASGTPITFGVDLSAPTLSVPNAGTINGVIVNAANQATAPASISLAYSDDIGFGATPIDIQGTRRARGSGNGTPTAAVSIYCFNGITAGAATFSTTAATSCPFVAVAGTNAIAVSSALTGQYEFTIRTRDQAGNLSSTAVVTRYVDITAPTVQGISLPQTLTGNAAAQFTTGATDNLELGQAYAQVGYGAAPAGFGTGPFQIAYTQSLTQLGAPFGDISASVNNSIPLNVPSFIRSVTFTAAGGVPQTPSAANLAQSIVAVVTDAALAPAAPANQGTATLAIPAGNIAQGGFGATIFDTGNQTSDINGFSLSFSNGAAAFPAQISLGGTANAPTTGTFSVTTTGQVNAFINPFVRVELYYLQVNSPAVYQFLGTAPVGIVTDDVTAPAATGRAITSNFVFTPVGTPLARGVTSTTSVAYNVIAVGITANGDALVSNPFTVTVIQ
jgi:uncharacterized protein YjdB